MKLNTVTATKSNNLLLQPEVEVLMVLREWYRAKQTKDRVKERQEGYKEGFEAGRTAEREGTPIQSQTKRQRWELTQPTNLPLTTSISNSTPSPGPVGGM